MRETKHASRFVYHGAWPFKLCGYIRLRLTTAEVQRRPWISERGLPKADVRPAKSLETLCKYSLTMASVLLLALSDVSFAQEDGVHNLVSSETAQSFEEQSYSPYVGRNFPTKPLWGDTHLHTASSTDAFGYGGRLDAEETYRFARGEEVRLASGQRVRLSRPLDE